ncbi:hypothetical protein [Patulibacter sp.]|uniref:hypothetical protein n=1 Tax=Patulibacter sp. TaxID=1912859 RepID=UPI00272C98D2|nr:hypothetical protein [Patulibacter sp.]
MRSLRCVANGTMRGTVVARPGGTGDLLAIEVRARRTLTTNGTYGRARSRVTLELTPAAPGKLIGTVRARGRVTLNGRSRPCSMRETVTLRSRAALAAPGALATDPLAPRVGLVESRIAPRVPGAIALTGRRDGTVHGFWFAHQTCRSGTKRSAADLVNVIERFRIRADGSFRHREVSIIRRRVPEGRSRVRFVATISGRIGADGVARGRIAVQSRDRVAGFDDLVCRTPSTAFTAAPAA